MNRTKKITYNDILEKLGVSLNNGNLEYMDKTQEHSYIYNKYFSSKKVESIKPNITTFNDYIKYKLVSYIQQQQAKEIKPKKINYYNGTNNGVYTYNFNYIDNPNKLFKMMI